MLSLKDKKNNYLNVHLNRKLDNTIEIIHVRKNQELKKLNFSMNYLKINRSKEIKKANKKFNSRKINKYVLLNQKLLKKKYSNP